MTEPTEPQVLESTRPSQVGRVASDAFAPAPGEAVPVAEFPRQPLVRLAQVLAVLIAASLGPFVHPVLDEYRYWERFDWTPIGRAVGLAQPLPPEVVTATDAPKANEGDELDDDAVTRMAGLHSRPAALAADASAGQAVAGLAGDATSDNPLNIDDAALADQKVWLQGDLEHGAPLFQALVDLAGGRRRHVRIAHYGDSHIANDGITHVTRLLLQKRFGDGGHGFVLPQGRTEWYSHKGIDLQPSDGWTMVNFLNGNAKDGAYGYGGVGLDGDAGDSVTWSATGKATWSVATVYLRSKGKAQLVGKIDNKAGQKYEIAAGSPTELAHSFAATDGKHALTVRLAAGKVRLFGVALERESGVVYDSLGEVGARGVRWKNADSSHMQAMMALRKPDAIIVNYGGNERLDKLAEGTYVQRMNDVVSLLKANRTNVACLVFGPSDHGVREKGVVVSDPAIVKLIRWQRRVAQESKCLFFDTRGLMGGEGSMDRWVKQGLGWSDYSHFTA
ncbi:MAG: hypothetical protein EXR77_20325, partial [Myxococcales bacterium]|nr:hypothetical protein [Myxococcales bacterium]